MVKNAVLLPNWGARGKTTTINELYDPTLCNQRLRHKEWETNYALLHILFFINLILLPEVYPKVCTNMSVKEGATATSPIPVSRCGGAVVVRGDARLATAGGGVPLYHRCVTGPFWTLALFIHHTGSVVVQPVKGGVLMTTGCGTTKHCTKHTYPTAGLWYIMCSSTQM